MHADEEVAMHRARLSVTTRLQRALDLADVGNFRQADTVLADELISLDNLIIQACTPPYRLSLIHI